MEGRNRCKVGAAIERYDIDSQGGEFESINEELLARWTGESGREPDGYRSLAAWFNEQLLRSAYDANGRLALGARLESELETLTGDDDIARGELLDELEQEGIDGQQLRDDMVSFSTIRRHLTGCLDGQKAEQEAETNWEEESVEIATEKLREKVRKALSSHENKGRLPGATDAGVSVQIQLSCPECPTRRTLTEALRLGYVCEDHLDGEGDLDGERNQHYT